jgi:MmyB-like transcription regulator ligand binding domain/Helix-turn-helix domain
MLRLMTHHPEYPDHDGDELREFLRSRRARITPEEAGLPAGPGHRRVPGLRRVEVAQLAGVSADLYDRLEGGRARDVPEAVLEALAGALHLDDADRDELFAAAWPGVVRRRPMRPQRVRPALRRIVDTLTDVPALVLGHRLDLLAVNQVGIMFYPDLPPLVPREGNFAWYLFTVPAARELHGDWPAAARGVVAALHRYAAHHPYDPELVDLVAELSVGDQDFRRWWGERDQAVLRPAARKYRHPLVGDLTLAEDVLTPAGEADQTLELLIAEPGTASEARLRLLAYLATAPLTTDPRTG